MEGQALGCREDECRGEYGKPCGQSFEQVRSGLWATVEEVMVEIP